MTTGDVVTFPDRNTVEAEAAEWLIRLDADEALSPGQMRALREWLKQSPAHRSELVELARLWEKMNILTELGVPLGEAPRPKARAKTGLRVALAGAATIVLVIVGAGLVGRGWQTMNPTFEHNGLYRTAIGEQRETVLADGTIIQINTDSRIQVAYDNTHRDVHLLRGEAYFTVAENAAAPFRVFAGDSIVQTIGTAFAVRLTEQGVDVTVTDGAVALAAITPAGQLDEIGSAGGRSSVGAVMEADVVKALGTLTVGQSAVISVPEAAETPKIEIDVADNVLLLARRLSWREGVLTFTGEPLAEVVSEISRYTTVDIRIADPAIRARPVGGRFPIGETDTMLAHLEENFGLKVMRLGPDQVLLSAEGE